MLVEIILQIKNVICGDDAFTGEHVNPVSDGSRLGQGRGFARDHLLQIAQPAREHVRWRSKAGCFRRAKKIHYVSRIETDLLVGFRRPITECALIVLPASQNPKDFFDLCICLRATEPEIGLVREQEPAECSAGELLAATVGKIFQKNVKTVRQTQRDGCNRGFALGELGINLTRNRNVRVSFFEIPAANIGRVGNGWTDAQRSSPASLNPISAGYEFDFASAALVVDMEAQL